ncbi:iron chelate uptake ABC transporter family permease subunit, partial [Halomonas sp. EGI 63088]
TGGLLLVFADWCGRMMMFPYQIPAGLLSTFIGAPYFIYLLRKQSRKRSWMASTSPVALSLTGATALGDLVARRRRNAPPPGKSLATINKRSGDMR